MSVDLLHRLVIKIKSQVMRVLGIENIYKRLDSLENNSTYKKNPHNETALDPLLITNILTSLQKITESIVTIDKRLGAYRSALFLSHISEIFPKTNTVVFAGGSIFGDNVKYAFLSFLEIASEKGISCYFLPYNSDQYELLKTHKIPCLPPALSNYSPDDINICLSAKVLVLDNHFVPLNWRNYLPNSLLKGAKSVQLWHGIPIKEIGLETVFNIKIDDPNTTEILSSCGPFDVFVGTNEASRAEWMRKFSFKSFSPIGYPRNDILLREASAFDKINVDAKALSCIESSRKNGQSIIFYTPTFRDHGESLWFNNSQISVLADYCATNNCVLFVKLHPVEQNSILHFRQHYPNINFIESTSDIYPLIKYASILITDYSSLAFDFLLLDRPIIFYRPDHSDYVTRSRHLIIDHDQYLCGAVSSNIHELIKVIDDTINSTNAKTDPYMNSRHSLRKKLFDYNDSLASQRVCDVILSLMESVK